MVTRNILSLAYFVPIQFKAQHFPTRNPLIQVSSVDLHVPGTYGVHCAFYASGVFFSVVPSVHNGSAIWLSSLFSERILESGRSKLGSPLFHLGCWFTFCGSRSYFQHCSSVPVHFWFLCTILLHNPIGVWYTLVYHCCWFPCSILPVLDPNSCTWGQFNVIYFWLVPLPLDEFLTGLVHFWGT